MKGVASYENRKIRKNRYEIAQKHKSRNCVIGTFFDKFCAYEYLAGISE